MLFKRALSFQNSIWQWYKCRKILLSTTILPNFSAKARYPLDNVLFPFPPEPEDWFIEKAEKAMIDFDMPGAGNWKGRNVSHLWVASGKGLLFHSLEDARILVMAYRLSFQQQYLSSALEMAVCWINECLYEESDPDVWSDHATALRALVLVELIQLLSRTKQHEDLCRKIKGALTKHAARLSNIWLYRHDHNHGIVQAYALLVIGSCFPEERSFIAWRKTAIRRLERQLRKHVSLEGFHREHSPHYQFFVMRHFLYAWQTVRNDNRFASGFSRDFSKKLGHMFEAASYLVKPGNKMACLGDTYLKSRELIRENELSDFSLPGVDSYLLTVSRGKKKDFTEKSGRIFREAGLAVFRKSQIQNEFKGLDYYLIIRTGTFNTAHIHKDLGSFEWFCAGSDVITDSGGPYQYGHVFRDYFTSTWAHNTIVVDGKNQNTARADIKREAIRENYFLLELEHHAFKGLTHRRLFIGIFPGLLFIFDDLCSNKWHFYEQIFHLSPHLVAKNEGHHVSATANDDDLPNLTMLSLYNENMGLKIWRDQQAPPKGQICTGEKEMITGSTVVFHKHGMKEIIATALIAGQGQQISPEVSIVGNPFYGKFELVLAVTGKKYFLKTRADGSFNFRNCSPGGTD